MSGIPQNDPQDSFAHRRQHPRFRVNLEVHYRAEGEKQVNYSENVSLGGVFIHTRKPLPPGTPVILSFKVPGGDQCIQMEGEVVWASCTDPPGPDDARSGMGVQFLNLHTVAEKKLGELLKGRPAGQR